MRIILTIFTVLYMSQSWAKVANDCDCPEVKCSNACEIQDGVTFYTAKCDDGKKVKSCAKPTCNLMKDDFTPECLAFQKSKGQRNVASEASTEKKKDDGIDYMPVINVGKIGMVKGKAWLKSENGARRTASVGQPINESDTIITSNNGKVKVDLIDGNNISVLPNSQTKMTKVTIEGSDKKTLIDLIRGKVRSKVEQKYKGANYFKVRTRSAVAGVRGTDFVVSYEVTGKAITKVQTINGAVELASGDEKQSQSILAGQEGSFVVAANMDDVFNENEISEFISRGYMTPVYKMTAAEIKKLNWETDVNKDQKVERAIAKSQKSNGNICDMPNGKLNQCLWSCVNNPKGESRCRTDLPQVNCVRKRCNANGDWADDARLPASYYDMCKPVGDKVGPCDY